MNQSTPPTELTRTWVEQLLEYIRMPAHGTAWEMHFEAEDTPTLIALCEHYLATTEPIKMSPMKPCVICGREFAGGKAQLCQPCRNANDDDAPPTVAKVEAVAWVRKDELAKATESAYLCRLVGRRWPNARAKDMVTLYTHPAPSPWREKLMALVRKWQSEIPVTDGTFEECEAHNNAIGECIEELRALVEQMGVSEKREQPSI